MRSRFLFSDSRWAIVVLIVMVAALGAQGKTTTSGADGNWNAISWSGGTPAEGDTVIIANNVIITNSPPNLVAYTVNAGKTNTFCGWSGTVLSATTITVNGTITHTNQSALSTNASGVWVPDARIQIVCETLTVSGAGRINADGKGYCGGTNNSVGGTYAFGPGAGIGQTGSLSLGTFIVIILIIIIILSGARDYDYD